MNDLVDRLRGRARGYRIGGPKQMAVMLDEAAARIEKAVDAVLSQGLRTPDIYSEGTTKVSTVQMGDAVVKALG